MCSSTDAGGRTLPPMAADVIFLYTLVPAVRLREEPAAVTSDAQHCKGEVLREKRQPSKALGWVIFLPGVLLWQSSAPRTHDKTIGWVVFLPRVRREQGRAEQPETRRHGLQDTSQLPTSGWANEMRDTSSAAAIVSTPRTLPCRAHRPQQSLSPPP